MASRVAAVVFCLVCIASVATTTTTAFVPSSPEQTSSITSRKTSLNSVVAIPSTAEAVQEMANARFAFGLCFYGALGVGSIGRELIPIVFGRYQSTNSLESSVVTSTKKDTAADDGEDMGIWGYPEKIYRRDVETILNNKMTPMAIAKKYPIEQQDKETGAKRYAYTHMAESVPFLSYEGFAKANPKANPVALRAVFDSFSNSIGGSNAVSPITAQRNIDSFLSTTSGRSKQATITGELAKKLNGGKATGIAAFVFVLVLLGVGDGLAIFHLWKGWFPEWQGFSNMPNSLFDNDIGIAVLPNFFVGDVPKM